MKLKQMLFPKIKVRVHTGMTQVDKQTNFYVFFTVTNISKRDVEVTHTWLEIGKQQQAILNTQRPLPKRLQPMESWETWFPFVALSFAAGIKWWKLGRARLSTGEVYNSKLDKMVPSAGMIPGGLVDTTDAASA